MTRTSLKRGVRRWAQVPQAGGAEIIWSDGDEAWDEAVNAAVAQFSRDRPNTLTADAIVTTAGFRQPLSGTGALLTGAGAWIRGTSYLSSVYFPWLTTSQGLLPLDEDAYRLVMNPDGQVLLEFLLDSPAAGDTIRIVYRMPHVVDVSDDSKTTVLAVDETAFTILTAYYVLTMAANRAVQNTGNSGFPTDIVDRRPQSDQYRSRAKDLWLMYASMMGIAVADAGKGTTASMEPPLSAFKDLDLRAGTPLGFLWRRD